MDEEPLQQREDDERPGVADVDPAVHGRPADVDADRGLPASFAAAGPSRCACRAAKSFARSGNPSARRAVRLGGAVGCPTMARTPSNRGELRPREAGVQVAAGPLPRRRRRASTPPTTSRCATSVTPGRSGATATPPGCARAPPRRPDVTMSTDADTWLRLREGEFSGSTRSSAGCSRVRGNLDHAIAFEGMFRLPGGRPPLVEIHDIPVGRHRVSTLTMGQGPDVLLLHGLGGDPGLAVRDRGRAQRATTASTRPTSPASAPRPSRRSAATTPAGSPRSCSG